MVIQIPRKEQTMALILHAEDRVEIREGFARRLKRAGYDVVSAEDGKAAWELLCGMPVLPDIIISDFDMPNMNGGQFLVKVRDHEEFRGIPFTLFTATKRDFGGKLTSEFCAELHAHHIDKGKWDGDMKHLLKPLTG